MAPERDVDAAVDKTAASGDDASDCTTRPLGFWHSDKEEPHCVRKTQILQAHPEIKKLMHPETRTKWMVLATVWLQVYMATLTLEWSWPAFLVAVYVVGATANHSLFLAIHEISHNLAFRDVEHNKMLSIFANMPIGIPFCTMFKPFHILHHRYQGTEGVDTDIPSNLEAWLITSTSTSAMDHSARKLIFVCFHSFAYALRPIFLKPHLVVYDRWLAANWIAQLTFNAMFWHAHGGGSLLYFLLSTLIAGSLHPMAGHFIAEHYLMSPPAETYSYYGPLNYLAYNVGYHNEHHDFPNIPWSNLPRVRAIAPEFYDHLPQCHSWPGTLARFITRDAFSPFSRMQRVPKSKDN